MDSKRKRHETDDEDSDEEENSDGDFQVIVSQLAKKLNDSRKKKKEKGKKLKGSDEECNGEESSKVKGKETEDFEDVIDIRLVWPEDDMCKLAEKVESQIPHGDTIPYHKRITRINWEKVSFHRYSAEECKKKFHEILSKQRTYRTCSEIIQDIKEWVKNPWMDNSKTKPKKHPDMPHQPLSSYMLFFQEKKNSVWKKNPNMSVTELAKVIGEMFKSLPVEKKEKYRLMALERRNEYNIKLKEFYEKHPDALVEKIKKSKKQVGPVRPLPPFKLFCAGKIEKHKNDPDFDSKKLILRCKEQWKKMSDKKKSVWIRWTLEREEEYLEELEKYISEHPEFDSNKLKQSVLTKEERAILDRLSGKPKRPPTSAYSYFCSINMSNDSYHRGLTRLKDLAERWKAVPAVEKKAYAEKVRRLQEKYKKDLVSYIDTLPEQKRKEEFKKLEESSRKKKKKKAPPREESQPLVSKWVEKKKSNLDGKIRYKNEPLPPPKDVLEYFVKQFSEKHPNLSKEKQIAKAKLLWSTFSREKKNRYEEELNDVKRKYITEFENFLKSLSEKELAEYSVFKSQRLKSNVDDDKESISSSSSEDSDDGDDNDNNDDDSDNNDGEEEKDEESSSSDEDESDSD